MEIKAAEMKAEGRKERTRKEEAGRNDEGTVPQIPQTGDDAHIALWIVMLAISAAGAAAFRRRVRKEY